ncbi:MAG: site-specific integrase [Gammaproteobacteria bacterium]|nr:site-specific integrase [Gammaproteobacteria bacterium]
MSGACKVKLLKLMSGERFPLLLDGEGRPLFEPTVYALTELRAKNQATNTISSNLRSIQVFYLFLEIREIDLSARLSSGTLLSLGEVEELTRMCRLPVARLEAMRQDSVGGGPKFKVVSLEKVRLRMQGDVWEEVAPAFAGTRMLYIRSYIEWLVSDRLGKNGLDTLVSDNLLSTLNLVLPAITARIPKGGSHRAINQREGLAPESVAELLRVVSPQSPDNPWRGEYARQRNDLIVHWLHYLGLRRGELLGVRVSDVDFRKGTVTIHRRADDVNDSRTNQPQSKTKAREIPLSEGLKSLTYAYVMNYRSVLDGSRKHDFLFCADVTGQPMSLPTLNKVFRVLREKCPNLPNSLCPHVLRHTWNDRFSEEMDKRQTSEESEKKLRSYLMGWSETSGTAATYTRRHIRKKAQEVSLKMQEQMKGEGQGNA